MAGARHSKTDQEKIQTAHDAIVAAGAACGAEDEPDAETKALDLHEQLNAVTSAIYRAIEKARKEAWERNPEACVPYVDPIKVYADGTAVARFGLTYYRMAYTLTDDGCTVPPFEEWQRVEETWTATYGAIKSLGGDGEIGGYAILYGNEQQTDVSELRDFFTKTTEYWLDAWQTRPMTYDHGKDGATKDVPVVGVWTKAIADDIGVWVEGQLDLAHRYYQGIQQLVTKGVMGLSGETIPAYMRRTRTKNGAHKVDRWPIAGISLTTHPAEPRLAGSVDALNAAYKSIGMDLPALLAAIEPEAASTGASAQRDDAARRLRVKLNLLKLS